MTKSKLPLVSFIIPTLNAAFILERCLQAIRSQDYPQEQVEIVIADGGSTDRTRAIAKKYHARVIDNPEVLHEPGKDRASAVAKGEILFFVDADNILTNTTWITSMIQPYLENPSIKGFLSQTVAAPDTNSFDKYLGYLATDPLTWFIYRYAAAARTYESHYKPVKKTSSYTIYKFPTNNHPLFGLSQGVGTVATFKRGEIGHSDDILSGIKLIHEGGLIVYVPNAGIYHYHVRGLFDFLKKYRWRIRNNLNQKVKGMGLIHRQRFFTLPRKLRQYLFPVYSFSIVLPLIDSIGLFYRYRDIVVFWHPIACICLSFIIIKEMLLFIFGFKQTIGTYGK